MIKKSLFKCALLASAMIILSGCGDDGKKSGGSKLPSKTVESGVVTPTDAPEEPEIDVDFGFSEKSGFYSGTLPVSIICKDKNAKIYYTLDGSTPSDSSTLYEEGSKLELTNASSEPNVYSAIKKVNPSEDYVPKDNVLKANVIRAIAYYEDGSTSDIINGTYFVGLDQKELFGDVPVISMFTDPSNLFDYETGIYVLGKTHEDWLKEDPGNKKLPGWQQKGNFSNKGREWERPATIQFFDEKGELGFESPLGIRVMGAASRGVTQKSFKLLFREEYGQKNLKYDLFPGNMREDGTGPVTKYKSFVLRNGGNDNDYAKLRDPLLQDLVSNRSFDTQFARPAILFLDGEYWGMYSMNELYSDDYVENNYGIEDKNVVVIKRGDIEDGEDDDIELYNEMKRFIRDNDMSNAANYKKACEMLDMVNFAEYCAFNLYIYNQDSIFDDNNWEMWRVKEPDNETPWSDGKWRMMCYDTEYSTGLYDGGGNYNTNSISRMLKKTTNPAKILQSLLANEEFRALFVNTLCDMANIDFEENRAKEYLVMWSVPYKKLAPDTFDRFGPKWIFYTNSSQYHSERISELRNFLVKRPDSFIKHIKDSFELEDFVRVTITSNDYNKGSFTLNTSKITFNDEYTGKYYTEYPLTINAAPSETGTFDHWEVSGGTIADTSSPSTTVTLSGDCEIKAIYK